MLSSQTWFWAMLLPCVSVPVEGLSVPFPGASRSHPIAFLLQNKEHAGTFMGERDRHRAILQLLACLCSIALTQGCRCGKEGAPGTGRRGWGVELVSSQGLGCCMEANRMPQKTFTPQC